MVARVRNDHNEKQLLMNSVIRRNFFAHCTRRMVRSSNVARYRRSVHASACMRDYVASRQGMSYYQTVYLSCSASVPFFTRGSSRTPPPRAAVRRIATQYSFNSSSVGSERTRSAGDVPDRTTGKASSVSDPAGSSVSIAAVGRYAHLLGQLATQRRRRTCEQHVAARTRRPPP